MSAAQLRGVSLAYFCYNFTLFFGNDGYEMKKVVFACLAAVSLFAQLPEMQQLVAYYRNGQSAELAQRFEAQLLTLGYWKSVVGDANTSLGLFETDTDLLVCNKEAKDVTLYRYRDGTLAKTMTSEAVVGKARGDKKYKGDLRTPEGIYRLVEKKEHVDAFYGPFAYVTSYPNLYDKAYDKNGYGIWLHGFPPHCDDKNATKGCVALNNEALKRLDRTMAYDKTVMVITRQGMVPVDRSRLAELMRFIHQWRYDWKMNNLEAYLSAYGERFRRYDGMRLDAYRAMKTRIFSRQKHKEIFFSRFRVVPFDSRGGKQVWYVSFWEEFKTAGHDFSGKKTLFIEDDGTRFEIVAEQ
jgi:murein L,D-transpeptidase YafK